MSKAVFTVHSEPANFPAFETVRFAGFLHPRLRVAQPVNAAIERLPGEVRAGAFGVSVTGRSLGEAMQALGRALAIRYYEGSDASLSAHVCEFAAGPTPSARRAIA